MSGLQRGLAIVVAVVTAIGSATALAAPPTEEPTVEPAVELVPEATPESEVDTPPTPEVDTPLTPEVEPVPELLPSWDATPEAEPLVRPNHVPEAPPDGSGRVATGSILFSGGLVLAASSAVLMFADDDEQFGVWIAGATFGTAAVFAGVGLLASGLKVQRRYQPWRAEHQAPSQGAGMLAGGILTTTAGTLGMLFGGISLTRQTEGDLPYGETLLGLGATATLVGVGLMIVGSNRRHRFHRWEAANLSPSVSLLGTPTNQLKAAGATLGVTGRF